MARIFFSYRKQGEDKPSSLRLADDFSAALGDDVVFRDEQGLKIGRFEDQLISQLESCEIMVVVIGPTWIERIGDLESDKDWVRREIETGLERGIEIAPILVEGARQPLQSDLPPSLANLSNFQFSNISSKHWRSDVDELIDTIAEKLDLKKQEINTVRSAAAPMSKNVVLCFDGFGLLFSKADSNVSKFYRVITRDASQVAYYDPWIGSLAQKVDLLFNLAFGMGLKKDVEKAYRFLMEQYRQGDRLFIFGFGGGAYKARVLAGLIHCCGLLEPDGQNLLPYVMTLYKAKEIDTEALRKLRSEFTRTVKVDFLGLWDSVEPIGLYYAPRFLPYTINNESVQAVRHALAIDERRSLFKDMPWGDEHRDLQDIKEVWFAGVHADVGGGYDESSSGLAKIALKWMIEQAVDPKFGLKIDQEKYETYVLGNGSSDFISPDSSAEIHESLVGIWRIEQWRPRRIWLADKGRKMRWRPVPHRAIKPGSTLHHSVPQRMRALSYAPRSLNGVPVAEIESFFEIEGS